MSNVSQRLQFDIERSLASTSFNGTFLPIGVALIGNPVLIIFDNQTDVSVPLSADGVNIWKTFTAGEAIILDLRANNGIAANYSIDRGIVFYTNASVGTSGSFRISVTYAR